jgi:hypothetical protein
MIQHQQASFGPVRSSRFSTCHRSPTSCGEVAGCCVRKSGTPRNSQARLAPPRRGWGGAVRKGNEVPLLFSNPSRTVISGKGRDLYGCDSFPHVPEPGTWKVRCPQTLSAVGVASHVSARCGSGPSDGHRRAAPVHRTGCTGRRRHDRSTGFLRPPDRARRPCTSRLSCSLMLTTPGGSLPIAMHTIA